MCPEPMESRIYISQGGSSFGPYTESQCIQMLRSGLMAPTDFACRHGMNEWRPLIEIMPGAIYVQATPHLSHLTQTTPVNTSISGEETVGQVVGQMAIGCLVWLGVLGLAIGGGIVFPLLLILAPIAIVCGMIDL